MNYKIHKILKSRRGSVDDVAELIIVVIALALLALFILIWTSFQGSEITKDFDTKQTEITANSALLKFLQSTIVDDGKEKTVAELLVEMEKDSPNILESPVDDKKANLIGLRMGNVLDNEIGSGRWYVFIKYSEKFELEADNPYSFITGKPDRNKFIDNCNNKYRKKIATNIQYHIPKPETKNNADVVTVIMEAC
ncbi:MAG TPA: hypothetical protein VI894_02510 [Candidatus Nanoarchaeia archaeon]|nr:hypothetical protein [Candidatus Nanoarchaeia archaeon]